MSHHNCSRKSSRKCVAKNRAHRKAQPGNGKTKQTKGGAGGLNTVFAPLDHSKIGNHANKRILGKGMSRIRNAAALTR